VRGSLDQPVRVRQAQDHVYLECMLQVVFLTRHTGLVTAAIELIPMALTTALDLENHQHRHMALTTARYTGPARLMPPSAVSSAPSEEPAAFGEEPLERGAFGEEPLERGASGEEHAQPRAPPLQKAGRTPSGESLEGMLEGLRDVEDETLRDDTLSIIEVPGKGEDDTLSVDLDVLTPGDLISLYGDGFVLH